MIFIKHACCHSCKVSWQDIMVSRIFLSSMPETWHKSRPFCLFSGSVLAYGQTVCMVLGYHYIANYDTCIQQFTWLFRFRFFRAVARLLRWALHAAAHMWVRLIWAYYRVSFEKYSTILRCDYADCAFVDVYCIQPYWDEHMRTVSL